MIRGIHKRTKIILWVIAAIFIGGIFSFTLSPSPKRIDYVAKVNGKKIPFMEFYQLYAQMVNQLQQNNPEQQEIPPEKQKELMNDALNSLVQQEILYQEAIKLGIKVDTREIISAIHSFPQFQDEKGFNQKLYLETLYYNQIDPQQYEENIKQLILIQKLQELILSSVKITNQELEKEYLKRKSEENFNLSKEEFYYQYRQEKQNKVYQKWMSNLFQTAKINYYLEQFLSS